MNNDDRTTPGAPTPDAATGHGSIRLIEERCTSCMICVRECPTWCITIEAHSEVLPDEQGHHPSRQRVRTVHVLDEFTIDWALCMYCGICIEECPFDALEWAGPHVLGAADLVGLVHDRHALAEAGSR
ncbi:4Fe-4S binding protein [Aestuariimicrobium ganziense]|uniref:4Fe-4S binding protein n=1 Tax=Aestuariimicrobium ganziense TaxID=2773677 RepID=UPI001943E849|nr:4Fe-4S binding protein [Aestuariimicrobium ganziense]